MIQTVLDVPHHQFILSVDDGTAVVDVVTPTPSVALHPGHRVLVTGVVEGARGSLRITDPVELARFTRPDD